MTKTFLLVMVAASLAILPACDWSRLTPTQKGALTGAAVGAGAGALLGPDKALQNAAIGAAAGTALGAGTGYLVSR